MKYRIKRAKGNKRIEGKKKRKVFMSLGAPEANELKKQT
jgi:hypothetical protein